MSTFSGCAVCPVTMINLALSSALDCHEEYLVGTDWSWPACHEIDQLHFEERGGDAIRISKRKVHCGMYET